MKVLEMSSGFKVIRFRADAYKNYLDVIMSQIIRQAARNWLRAVLSSVPGRSGFPVVTGAAKSTLVPLGKTLGVAVPVTPQRDMDGYYRGDRRQLGLDSQFFEILDNKSQGQRSTIGTQYVFSWITDLDYFETNDQNNIGRYTPWKSMLQAQDAWDKYLLPTILKRLPTVAKFLKLEGSNG